MKIPEYIDVEAAHERIRSVIHKTPVFTCSALNKKTKAELYFKCENFQRVGAFKFRGASNAVMQLTEEEKQKGVATHSSGNHGAALALAAKLNNVPSTIVVPINAPTIKKEAISEFGGRIMICEPTLKDREDTLQIVVDQEDATVIHPYNNFNVIAGQGTCAKEFLEEVSNLDIVMTPVGGGGLLAGTALSVKAISPKTKVIAAEPKNADDAYRSFKDGVLYPSVNPQTIADGLLTSVGEINFEIIKEKVDDIMTVSEESIVDAMRMIWERMNIIIEPSSAVPLAAVLENEAIFAGKKVGIILTGGNLNLEKLPFKSKFPTS
ncbi:pyridoxal-phosphate dependent enzyme [Prolixibacteraceae bacterium JC049]|nr:pyridoxal-phosphate dependent enzyme [Prolixibacteraceae bacterium JC049]